jgi:hypothetical protein
MRIEKGEKMNALPTKKPLTKDVILSKTIEIAVKKGKLIIPLNELSDELKKEYDITNLKVLIEQLWKEGKILLSWENQHLTTFDAEEQLRKEINELIELLNISFSNSERTVNFAGCLFARLAGSIYLSSMMNPSTTLTTPVTL